MVNTNGNENLTHCPQGHEYTPENIYRTPGYPTRRYCRECRVLHELKRRKAGSRPRK